MRTVPTAVADDTCAIRCVITRRGTFTTHMRFWAETDDGRVVAQSEVFDGDYSGAHKHRPDHAAAHAGLLKELSAAGWEEIGRGERWYEVRLRRAGRLRRSRRAGATGRAGAA